MRINSFRNWEARATLLLTDESGMSTVEYAINEFCTLGHRP